MRQRPGFRMLSALLGLWFLLAGHEPPFAHPCHMGGRGAVATAPVDGAGQADQQAVAHGGHHAGHGETGAPGESDGPDTPPPCECIGECGALAPPPAVPFARQAWFAPAELRAAPVPLVAHVARIPHAPARVQPFANGPPHTTHA